MDENEKNTEEIILDAAKKVFLHRGFDGARMQEIADEAGINKALLHYYFRSKEKLFDAIFVTAFSQFLPRVSETMMSEKPFFEKIQIFVGHYVQMLMENPHLPVFILNELSRNPERIVSFFKTAGVSPEILGKEIQKNVKAGIIRPIDPRSLVVNLISLCAFPFAGKPLIKAALFDNNEELYQQFLLKRKTEVTLFITNALKPEKTL